MQKFEKGFEIFYHDGEGRITGPLDFERFMSILGEMDDNAEAMVAPVGADGITSESAEAQGDLFDRLTEEQEGAGTSNETTGGPATYGGL